MSRPVATIGAIAVLLAAGAGPRTAGADGPSGCVTCHLDEAMLVRNLAGSAPKKSALQSGAG
ncbi:MAG: hypothetical protein WB493_18855 [Anaeromyxobacteraceae bacterium]